MNAFASCFCRRIIFLVCAGILSAAAHADPVFNLAAGPLQIGSINNEFLLEFGHNGSGLETPYPAILNNGTLIVGSSYTTSYAQGGTQVFTFDFSFSVPNAAVIMENPTYGTYVGSTTSSVSLLQGANVVATGVETTPILFGAFSGANYFVPTTTLLANTQYDLVVKTLGLPSSAFNSGQSGTQGFGQIALDVSAVPSATVTPEPGSLVLLSTGLIGIAATVRRKYKAA